MKITRRNQHAITIAELTSIVVIVMWMHKSVVEDWEFSANSITAIATVATVILLYYTFKASRQSAEDAERPHISIVLRMTSDTNRVLVITNSGKSTAVDTKLSLVGVKEGLRLATPPNIKHEIYHLDETPLFTTGADLPSGWLYEFRLHHGTTYAADMAEMKHPRRFEIAVRYESLAGTVYEDRVPIDIDAHKHSLVPTHSASANIHILTEKLVPVLRDIKTELQWIRRNSE